MNILEICLSQYLGGLELYFVKCCLRLQKNHRVFVAYQEGSKISERLGSWQEPEFVVTKWNRYFPLKQAVSLARFINRNRIDIIHVHHSYDLLLCGLAKSFSKRKVKLVHTRQMEIPFSKHDPYHRWLYHRLDLMLVITQKLKDDSTRFVPIPSERIKLQYYGIEQSTGIKDCDALEKWDGSLKVGIVSRIDYSKGQLQVVKAARILKDRGTPIAVFLYGYPMPGDYLDEVRQTISHDGLEDTVHIMGFHDNPRAVMGCFDVVIQPSKGETFGLVLIEAMREGTAVIGTNAGGIPEIIDHGKTGYLFDFEDIEQLAEILQHVYEHPDERKKIALAGKEKADLEFDEKAHFASLEDHFRAISNGSR